MAVKRKSNWYIYFIAFGLTLAFCGGIIATFSWYFFPEETKQTSGLTSGGTLAEDFKPDSSHNFALVTALSDGESDIPNLFTMIIFNAVEHRVVVVPLPNGLSVATEERTLPNVYAAYGGQGIISAVADATGVTCDGYAALDRDGFVRLVSAYGNVQYNVPKTLIVNDNNELENFNKGDKMFSALSMFRYIYMADFGEDEQYRFGTIAELLAELINQNITFVDSAMLDGYFGIIADDAETNLTEDFYNSKKAAMLNTIQYGAQPAEYYIPYGEYTEDGGFKISENSVTTIKQKCGIY